MKSILIFCLFGIVTKSLAGAYNEPVFTTQSYQASTHPMDNPNWRPPEGPKEEQTQLFWELQGQKFLRNKLSQTLNTKIAKNVILFIGDGMGLSTQMATRVYLDDLNTELSFEKFPYAGLSKTYCINYQVPDSACTATALMSGKKVNFGTINVNGRVNLKNCTALQNPDNQIDSIFKYAQDAGKATGFVTNTRLSHATPAAVYAKAADRKWENDEATPEGCEDIAQQLITGKIGSKLDVAMGGGSRYLRPTSFIDSKGKRGDRTDNKNLVDEYLAIRNQNRKKGIFVETKEDLEKIDVATTDSVLGAFAHDHLAYRLDEASKDEPTLVDMTRQAINILKKNPNGFLLMVEGGHIDNAHHATLARKALDETVHFHETVEFVRSQVSEDDTLLIVTADHSHVFTVGGYPPRETDILGFADFSNEDALHFFTLNYANGMGYNDHSLPTGGRKNPDGMNFRAPNFRYPTTVPLTKETHGGEDVGVFAVGPYAQLFTGNYEQNFIPHGIMYAACFGPEHFKRPDHCANKLNLRLPKVEKF